MELGVIVTIFLSIAATMNGVPVDERSLSQKKSPFREGSTDKTVVCCGWVGDPTDPIAVAALARTDIKEPKALVATNCQNCNSIRKKNLVSKECIIPGGCGHPVIGFARVGCEQTVYLVGDINGVPEIVGNGCDQLGSDDDDLKTF